ncbi:HMG-box, partial [Rozella allomycis CSF55]
NKKPNKQLVKKTKPPKQPISSFLAFYRHKRSEMAKKHPELTFGQVSSKLGELWKSMNFVERRPFVDEANKDRIRFADEQEKYRELQAKKSKIKPNQDEEYNDKDIKKLKPVKENKKIK